MPGQEWEQYKSLVPRCPAGGGATLSLKLRCPALPQTEWTTASGSAAGLRRTVWASTQGGNGIPNAHRDRVARYRPWNSESSMEPDPSSQQRRARGRRRQARLALLRRPLLAARGSSTREAWGTEAAEPRCRKEFRESGAALWSCAPSPSLPKREDVFLARDGRQLVWGGRDGGVAQPPRGRHGTFLVFLLFFTP